MTGHEARNPKVRKTISRKQRRVERLRLAALGEKSDGPHSRLKRNRTTINIKGDIGLYPIVADALKRAGL